MASLPGIALITALANFGWPCCSTVTSSPTFALLAVRPDFCGPTSTPAKIYMGDGRQSRGLCLAILLQKLRANAPTPGPGRDNLAKTRRRHLRYDTCHDIPVGLSRGRAPFKEAKTTQVTALVKGGVSVPEEATIYAAGAVLGGAAPLMSQLGPVSRAGRIVGFAVAAGPQQCHWHEYPFTSRQSLNFRRYRSGSLGRVSARVSQVEAKSGKEPVTLPP